MFSHVNRQFYNSSFLTTSQSCQIRQNIVYSANQFKLVFTRNTRLLSFKKYTGSQINRSITEPNLSCRIRLTWNTVTVAHRMLLKCFLSHSHFGCCEMISGQVQSRSLPLSSTNLQNLPPNRYMPRILRVAEPM